MTNTALVPGSVGAVAMAAGRSIAEAFLDVEAVVIVDTSGSMASRDSRGGASRYDVACQELAHLQAAQLGRLGLISFSSAAQFCPSGIPVNGGGSTDLAAALRLAKTADVSGMRFIVVSDGEPDSEKDALAEAARFSGRIDTIFVGPDGGAGADFLQRLAAASRGRSVGADRAKELAAATTLLLAGEPTARRTS